MGIPTATASNTWVDRAPVEVATGTIDFARSRFVHSDGTTVRLTAREAEVLAFLVDHADENVSRDDLLGAVWGHHESSLSRAVDAAMSRLRRKIDPDSTEPRVLFTVHGHGYRLLLTGSNPEAERVERAERAEPSLSAGRRVLTLGTHRVDLGAGYVDDEQGRTLLTARERLLLECLLRSRRNVVEAQHLARVVGIIGGKSALSNAISRLRAKVEDDPGNPEFLHAVRGEGYRLDAELPIANVTANAHDVALRSLAVHVGTVLGTRDCVVYRLEGGALNQVAAFGPKCGADGRVLQPLSQQFGEGIVGVAAASGRPMCVPDVANEPRYVRDVELAASELSVPILVHGEVVGVLDSESTDKNFYADALVKAFLILAAISAPAFRNVESNP